MAGIQLTGTRVKRVEDPRFLTGKGTFVDDVRIPGTLHVAFVRSTRAHAKILNINMESARKAPGVHAVFVGSDIKGINPIGQRYSKEVFPDEVYKQSKWPAMPHDRVRFVGEIVAAVIAESRYLAEDAVDLVTVDYEDLPVLTDPEEAMKPDAVLLHPEWGTNIMVNVGANTGDVEGAFNEAAVVIHERFHTNRHASMPVECRAILANYDGDGTMNIWATQQQPGVARTRLADLLNFPEQKIRLICPDVGGGFGPKAYIGPHDLLVPYFSKVLNKPVKWTEDRREHLLAALQAKEEDIDFEMAFTADGTLLGMKVKIIQDLGAYSGDPWPAPFEALQMAGSFPGPYKMKGYGYTVRCVWTNKMTVCAYRGVGLTPACYTLEHMMDIAARRLGMDPLEIRLKNMIRPEEFPYTTLTGLPYDSGSSTEAMKMAADMLGYKDFRKRQKEALAKGKYIGFGIGNYIEMTVIGTQFMAVIGVDHGWDESAIVRFDANGGVTLAMGTHSEGQGHATVFAQLAADELGMRMEDIRLLGSDSNSSPYGWGAGASRCAVAGGGAVMLAARKVKEKILRIAGKMLEVSPDDLELVDGKAQAKGAPAKFIPIRDIARICTFQPAKLPPGEESGLEATQYYQPPPLTFTNATHVCEVEVDIETGMVKLNRYGVVEDCGQMINPAIVDGQIVGGLAQGIGTVLYEECVYDENGQALTGSLMDYLVPSAPDVPHIEIGHMVTLSPLTMKGIKGMGEGGAIAPPAAIANALMDALAPFNVKFTKLPLSPQRVWETIRAVQQKH